MKKIRITVMRMACYKDLMEKYENPMEHACDMQVGQVFIANGWEKPEGLCESAWQSMSPRRHQYLRRMDEEREIGHDFVQRRLPAGQLSAGGNRINT